MIRLSIQKFTELNEIYSGLLRSGKGDIMSVHDSSKLSSGSKITIKYGSLTVPNNPVIPFIEGDGTGADIWRAAVRVLDAAVDKAYSGSRKIAWVEVLCR